MLKTHWRFSNKFFLQCWTSLLVIQVKDIIISGSFDSSSVWGQCPSTAPPLYHIFIKCKHTKQFWKEFPYYFYTSTRKFVCPSLKDVITRILYTNCPLLNYLILIAKLYLWDCRSNQTLPIITAFSSNLIIILSMKQKSIYVLKLIKWAHSLRSELCLWTLYPRNVCTWNVFFILCIVTSA